MSRLGCLLLVVVTCIGCEPAPGPPPSGASSVEARAAEAAAAEARSAREIVEFDNAVREPDRPGEALLRTWEVRTPQLDTSVPSYYARREYTMADQGECGPNVPLVYPQVKVWATRIEVWRFDERVASREYDVLRDSGREVEIQLRDGGERAVLTLSDDNKTLHAPDLLWLTGGAVWWLRHR